MFPLYRSLAIPLLCLGSGLPPLALIGQSVEIQKEIIQSQRRLEEVRLERESLRQEMAKLESQVRDASAELANVERQISVSRSAISEVNFQLDAVAGEIEASAEKLLLTRERLKVGTAVLNHRLRAIYKRGPLDSVRVLLGARSFSDILTAYRYLRLIASYDRALVGRVGELEADLLSENNGLEASMASLDRLRQSRLSEIAAFSSIEEKHRRALEDYRSQEQTGENRLKELEADELRISRLVADLEVRRLALEQDQFGPDDSGELGSDDAGALDWPTEGELIYTFGREERPNGTVLRWNGIGIGAETGTPVRAVRAGTVVLAGPFEGYGPTVVLSHGLGFYTLYLYLEVIEVIQGRQVTQGQVVGTVGGVDTPEGSHIEFQIRAPVTGGTPQAQDPLLWLRARGL